MPVAKSVRSDSPALHSIRVVDEADVLSSLENGALLVSLNAEKLYHLQVGTLPAELIGAATFTVDGKGGELFARLALKQQWARKFNLPALLFGADWLRERRILLAGSTADSIELAGAVLRSRGYSAVEVVDGYRDFDEYFELVRRFNPDVVFLGQGSPRQELLGMRLKAGFPGVGIVCVGGGLNVLAGTVDKCPLWIDRLGFEWLYRAVRDPKRISRLPRLAYLPVAIVRASRGR